MQQKTIRPTNNKLECICSSLLVACLFSWVLRFCLLALFANTCSHVCSNYGLRSLLKTIRQRIASTVVEYILWMDPRRTTLNEANTNTKRKERWWAYGAVGYTCGWYPEHFVNSDGFALANFSAAVYGPEYLALE